jgi:hypothetical protein
LEIIPGLQKNLQGLALWTLGCSSLKENRDVVLHSKAKFSAWGDCIMMINQTPRARRRTNLVSKSSLLSISYLALETMLGASGASAQSASQTSGAPLPPVTVTAPEAKRRANVTPVRSTDRSAQRRRSQAARRPEPTAAPKATAVSQDARTGTVGVYANSTSVATKTNTPLVNIPQSLSVITRDFIRDQAPIATNWSFAASIPARTSSSTASATTFSTFAISTTRKASRY